MNQSENHSFSVSEASPYGVNQAILLNNIRFWLRHNKANQKHIIDGYVWTYNSARAFAELFPYMEKRSISRYLKDLSEKGVLLVANHNEKGYDQTHWYTIPSEFSVQNDIQPSKSAIGQIVPSIGQFVPSIGQIVPPIPDINTNTKTNNNDNARENNQAAPALSPSSLLFNFEKTTPTSKNPLSEQERQKEKQGAEIVLVGLVGKDKAEASRKLSKLAQDQRAIAVQMFNDTVNQGRVKKNPMALLNQLVNLGLNNELEPPVAFTPTHNNKMPVSANNGDSRKAHLESIAEFLMTRSNNGLNNVLKTVKDQGYICLQHWGLSSVTLDEMRDALKLTSLPVAV